MKHREQWKATRKKKKCISLVCIGRMLSDERVMILLGVCVEASLAEADTFVFFVPECIYYVLSCA